ncbi:MAG: hypothetical protein CMJ44_06690 [Pimelobacter sp.]|nr:hypothetical protein [Pimelobacter sp.]
MRTPLRLGAGALTGLALAVSGLTMAGTTAVAAPAAAPAVPRAVPDVPDIAGATLTWGISGYAQDGIFGPWVIKDLAGDATLLEGTVSGGDQTQYVVEPIPATSMSPSEPQDTPNVVHFAGGSGSADPGTGAATLTWTGSYTVNAYPTTFGAPNEVYSDPALSIAEDGSGSLTMDVTIGAGQDMLGQPTPAVDLGRLTMMTFGAESDDRIGSDAFRYTPDYQGVEVEVASGSEQTRSCSTDDGATGWWGAWPEELVNAMPESVRPHFYSTGCAGKQDNKPPLPVDVDLGLGSTVSVAQTDFLPSGSYEVTVEGSGFDPADATGTRPPLAGKAAGTYVVFGKFADQWRPSTGAASSTRKISSQRWAVLAEDMATIGGAPAAVELTDDGTFSTTLTVDKAAIDEMATEESLVNYGIYTYPGSGAVNAAYETYTPITFTKAAPRLELVAPTVRYGESARLGIAVTAGAEAATGSVVVTQGETAVATVDLLDGTAVVALGTLDAGSYPLTATYSGDEVTTEGTASTTVRVARARTTTIPRLKRAPQPGRAGKAVVKVVSADTTVAGQVKVVIKKLGKKGTKVLKQKTTLRRGSAGIRIRKLAGGRYQLTATYLNDANFQKSSQRIRFRV